MSLKIVATLFLAGLATQSSASAIKSLKQEQDIPNYVFTSDELTMTATGGSLLEFMHWATNNTAWEFTKGDGFSTIKQTLSLPFLSAVYKNLSATVGSVKDEGNLFASFSNTLFTVSLIASGNCSQCELDINAASPQESVIVVLGGLQAVESTLAPEVRQEITTALWSTLERFLAPFVTSVLRENLPIIQNLDKLCCEILKANKEHYPQPQL